MARSSHIVEFTKMKEGGLSRAKTDSASKYPAPCLITYHGETHKDYHTNKGITYKTFFDNAKELGYDPSCKNFEKMPDSIWFPIFEKKYWNPFLLDDYKSQAIADLIASWAWGSGVQGSYYQLAKFLNNKYGTSLSVIYSTRNARIMRDKFNELSLKNENKVFDELISAKRAFLISLNQPANMNGWLNRLNSFYDYVLPTIALTPIKTAKAGFDFIRKNWLWVSLVVVGIGGITYAVVASSKRK